MASIGFGIATPIQGGSIALDTTDAAPAAPSQVVYHVPPPSQIPAAPSASAQQDTVTLSGTAPATGIAANSNGFVQVAAFTLLAQEFTFPPDASTEGAGAPAAAATNSASDATPADQTAALQQQTPLLTQDSVSATATAVATASAHTSTNAALANAGTNAADSAIASSSSVTAPQETLQQLDQELQRLGINPQDISLMNRMALLFWVNDPAALRQFVQGMQPSATNLQSNASSATLRTQAGVAQPSGGATANQNPNVSATDLSSGTQSQTQSQDYGTASPQNQSLSALPGANQNSGVAQTSGTTYDGAANQPNTPLQQNSTASLQFQQLQVSLAAASQYAQTVFASTAGSSAQGQSLNISA